MVFLTYVDRFFEEQEPGLDANILCHSAARGWNAEWADAVVALFSRGTVRRRVLCYFRTVFLSAGGRSRRRGRGAEIGGPVASRICLKEPRKLAERCGNGLIERELTLAVRGDRTL